MIRIVERTSQIKMEPLAYLKFVNKIIGEMASLLGQISFKLSEEALLNTIYFEEGTKKDKIYVETRIKKLQQLVNQLDQVVIMLKQPESYSHKEIQIELERSQLNIKYFRENMLLVWQVRNVGDTKKDNDTIQNLIKIMFLRINNLIKEVIEYVNFYNKTNKNRLKFNVKWTPLPR